MLFMVIENFRGRDAKAVYARFRDKGRMAPDGLVYVGSWVEANLARCFQLMECDDARLLQDWILNWADLADFEIVPVVSSKDAVEIVGRRLQADNAGSTEKNPTARDAG
ncbi:MAG: DUF3303 domain-containing protein [Hyphomicrobiaceae bacterium]